MQVPWPHFLGARTTVRGVTPEMLLTGFLTPSPSSTPDLARLFVINFCPPRNRSILSLVDIKLNKILIF